MKIIEQDMLEIESGVLFHQVNCQAVMGGGIAYAIAKKWPNVLSEYKYFCRDYYEAGDQLLGEYSYTQVSDSPLYVVNIFGQRTISTTNRMTSYDATVNAFETFKANNEPELQDLQFYFPYGMGCGLGGGNWNIYRAILEEYFPQGIICKKNG